MPEILNGLADIQGGSLPEGSTATLTIHYGQEPEVATALRAAFAYIRGNDDRRYSAAVKLQLLSHADRIEALSPDQVHIQRDINPVVGILTVPFNYDEETEVKAGGTLGCFVKMPDGRLLLAVGRNFRRQGIGGLLIDKVQSWVTDQFKLWIHRENGPGMSFAVAVGLLPREINRRGAVLFSFSEQAQEDDGAVATMNDDDIDVQLRGLSRRAGRAARAPRSVADDIDFRPLSGARGQQFVLRFGRFLGLTWENIHRQSRGYIGWYYHLYNNVPLRNTLGTGAASAYDNLERWARNSLELRSYLDGLASRRDFYRFDTSIIEGHERRELGDSRTPEQIVRLANEICGQEQPEAPISTPDVWASAPSPTFTYTEAQERTRSRVTLAEPQSWEIVDDEGPDYDPFEDERF